MEENKDISNAIPIETGNLKEQISNLRQRVDEIEGNKDKSKKFNIPFFSRLSKRNLKMDYVTVAYIGENRSVSFAKYPIQEGVINVNGKLHLATTEYMLNYKGKPFIIVPTWNIKPFSPERDYEQAIREDNTTQGHSLLLNYMEKEQITTKKPISTGMIIGGIVLLIIVGYLVSKGGFN